MPKLFLAAAAALALLFARGAQAEADLYLALDGGLSFAHDADVADNNGPNSADLRYAHGDAFRHLGWNANGALGIHINRSAKNSFRVDLSGGYRRNDIKKLVGDDGFTLARGGHTAIPSAMLNGYYEHDFGNLAWFKAFVGAGVGVGFVEFESGRSSSIVLIDDDSTQLAYQGTVGVAMPLGDHFDLTAAYRYFGTTTPSLSAEQREPGTGSIQRGSVDVDVGISDLLLGVRLTF